MAAVDGMVTYVLCYLLVMGAGVSAVAIVEAIRKRRERKRK